MRALFVTIYLGGFQMGYSPATRSIYENVIHNKKSTNKPTIIAVTNHSLRLDSGVGSPQCGHFGASLLILVPHAGHGISFAFAMIASLSRRPSRQSGYGVAGAKPGRPP